MHINAYNNNNSDKSMNAFTMYNYWLLYRTLSKMYRMYMHMEINDPEPTTGCPSLL